MPIPFEKSVILRRLAKLDRKDPGRDRFLSCVRRYKSIAILDEESLLATAAYIDLNPVAAGVSPTLRRMSAFSG
jgi:hypothetical protein